MTGRDLTTASHLVAPSQFMGPGQREQARTFGGEPLRQLAGAQRSRNTLDWLEEKQWHRTLTVFGYISSSSALGEV